VYGAFLKRGLATKVAADLAAFVTL